MKEQIFTCAYEHDMVLLFIWRLHFADYDPCEGSPLPYEYRSASDWLDSLIHERLLFDELKRPVWQEHCVCYAYATSFIVNTLTRGEGTKRLQKKSIFILLEKSRRMRRLTAPGRGTGTSPLKVTHLIKDVSTGMGVLYLPSENTLLMSDTLYAHTADRSDVPLQQTHTKQVLAFWRNGFLPKQTGLNIHLWSENSVENAALPVLRGFTPQICVLDEVRQLEF